MISIFINAAQLANNLLRGRQSSVDLLLKDDGVHVVGSLNLGESTGTIKPYTLVVSWEDISSGGDELIGRAIRKMDSLLTELWRRHSTRR
jgi:hypothetical protein